VRELVVDANDGIMAVAGIAEGFIGAGASTSATMIAIVAGAVAGSIALAGAKFTEAAIARDSRQVVLDEARRQLALSPEEELSELAALYEAKGLSADLAHQVANELSSQDALTAHADAGHGIEPGRQPLPPLITALLAGVAFAVGALIVVATILSTPRSSRLPTTFFAVALSLGLTSLVLARWGQLPVARTIVRNVGVGLTAMVVTLAIGSLFDL
jgi:VIT1/CCC1 family predicted Fe2+/Mn2+ transporter